MIRPRLLAREGKQRRNGQARQTRYSTVFDNNTVKSSETMVTPEFLAELKMPLVKAAKLIGLPVHGQTLGRWATRGVKILGGGTIRRLEVWRAGGRLLTSPEALRRFMEVAERGEGEVVAPLPDDRH